MFNMVKVTPKIFELLNLVKTKYSCTYKKTHRNPLWPIRRNDANGKIDNSVTNRAEFELLCRWIAAVLSISRTKNYKKTNLIY